MDLCILDVRLVRSYLDTDKQMSNFSDMGFIRFFMVKYGIYKFEKGESRPHRDINGDPMMMYSQAIPNSTSVEYLNQILQQNNHITPSTIISERRQKIMIHDLRMLMKMYTAVTDYKKYNLQCKTVCALLKAEC